MPKYDDHKEVLKLLKAAQDAEHDMREQARECHMFVNKRDGQWEPSWWEASNGKPRYTFDVTSPIVDQVAGEMESADFDIVVKPAGGDATKKTAQIYDGLIRNIENISGAVNVFNSATRNMLTGGLDGWRVVQKFVDHNSFDQDLIIEDIPNYIDRVWHDCAAMKQDKSDSKWAFVLQGISKDEFEKRFKTEREGQSVGTDSINSVYYHKPELIVVGEFYYIKPDKRELVLMSNGRVYEVDADYKKVSDDLAQVGVTEVRRRTRDINRVYVRFFDNDGWLGEAKKTVFSYIPVVPIYGNYRVFENKSTYRGVVEKLIDPQRVLNYSLSREIEEGALAPRAKYWMTKKQAGGHEQQLSTLNTNSDPVQFFTHDPDYPTVPTQQGGAQVNPGLRVISETMRDVIGQAAGLFAPNMGDNPGLQSGVAIRQLQDKGDNGTIKYFKAREIATRHTARILVDAIPKVYDSERQVRVLKEDGSFDLVTLNEQIIDGETGQMVTLNDLSQGTYDVTCSAGPAFKNRQEELATKIVELAKVDPTIIDGNADILLNNISAPGMDLIAERKRQELFNAGRIPESQMTDEEKEMLAAMQMQQQQPDAASLMAEAEMQKAMADQAKVQSDNQLKNRELDIKEMGLNLEMAKINQKSDDQAISIAQFQQEFSLKLEQMMAQTENTHAQTLKILREAIGAETIVGDSNMEAYTDKSDEIAKSK